MILVHAVFLSRISFREDRRSDPGTLAYGRQSEFTAKISTVPIDGLEGLGGVDPLVNGFNPPVTYSRIPPS